MSSYQAYVDDKAWLRDYDAYQDTYKVKPRKSDIDIAALIAKVARAQARTNKSGPIRLLDIGCSTGNLLRVIRAATVGLDMTFVGADLAESSIAQAKATPDLSEMRFELWDATALPAGEKFDLVVMSAVAFFFSDDEFTRMLKSVRTCLNPGGSFIAWELVSELPDYRVDIEEWSPFYNGRSHLIQIRSLNMIESEAKRLGFKSVALHPFTPPVLGKPDVEHYLTSYTVDVPGEGRRAVRGCVILPWGFLVASLEAVEAV
jgi:SAM-dependent methyltransferase